MSFFMLFSNDENLSPTVIYYVEVET
jgi:hypothetical protein